MFETRPGHRDTRCVILATCDSIVLWNSFLLGFQWGPYRLTKNKSTGAPSPNTFRWDSKSWLKKNPFSTGFMVEKIFASSSNPPGSLSPFQRNCLESYIDRNRVFFRANIGAEKENVIFTARQRQPPRWTFSARKIDALKSEQTKPWRQGLTHLGNFGSYTPLKNAALRVFNHFHLFHLFVSEPRFPRVTLTGRVARGPSQYRSPLCDPSAFSASSSWILQSRSSLGWAGAKGSPPKTWGFFWVGLFVRKNRSEIFRIDWFKTIAYRQIQNIFRIDWFKNKHIISFFWMSFFSLRFFRKSIYVEPKKPSPLRSTSFIMASTSLAVYLLDQPNPTTQAMEFKTFQTGNWQTEKT